MSELNSSGFKEDVCSCFLARSENLKNNGNINEYFTNFKNFDWETQIGIKSIQYYRVAVPLIGERQCGYFTR